MSSSSTSISESYCPGGFELVNLTCTISETFEGIKSSKQWRIWAAENHSDNGWDINDLAFYDNHNCTGSQLSDGRPIESGHYINYVPSLAFDGNISTYWGGRGDNDNLYWLGMEYNISREVSCISILDTDDRGVSELRVQAWQNSTATWQNAMIVKGLQSGQRKNITLNCPEGFELRQSACTNITEGTEGTKSSVGIVVGIIAVAMACIIAYIWWKRRKTDDKDNQVQPSPMNHSTTHLELPVAVADQFIMPPSSPSSLSIRILPDTYIVPPPTTPSSVHKS